MMPMRRAIKGLRHDEIRRLKREDTDTPLCQDDIEQSLLRINKTVSESDLGRFEEWLKEFGSTCDPECGRFSFYHWMRGFSYLSRLRVSASVTLVRT